MKRCLACDAAHDAASAGCPSCGFAPAVVDGVAAYAPDLALAGGGFDPRYFAELARLEAGNFWFRARNRLILWALGEYCGNFRSLLEIGCGTGYVLSGIAARFPATALYGSDVFVAGLKPAMARLPGAELMQMDAREIPFREEFDVIGAFDVLEHIDEDEAVLQQMYAALKPGGHILLTVPQHAWLWSEVDEHAYHVRRYAAAGLHRVVAAAGFRLARSTSFVTTLLPAMLLSRRLAPKGKADDGAGAKAELEISAWLNAIFFRCLGAEIAAIKRGIDLPFGGSRLVVASKPGAGPE